MYISVLPSDDYANTYGNVPATGNVLTNDIDPEGNTLVATPQSVTVPQGTLQLLANGQYTFTPAPGATGAADFTYTVCDNGQPQACGEGTLHILVDKGPDYTPGILGDSYTFLGADTTKDFIVTISNTNGTINKGAIRFFLPQYLPNLSISVDPAATLSGVYGGFPVANQDWNIQLQGSFYVFTLKSGVQFNAGSTKFIGIKVTMTSVAPFNQTFSLTSSIIAGSGGDSNPQNNSSNLSVLKN